MSKGVDRDGEYDNDDNHDYNGDGHIDLQGPLGLHKEYFRSIGPIKTSEKSCELGVIDKARSASAYIGVKEKTMIMTLVMILAIIVTLTICKILILVTVVMRMNVLDQCRLKKSRN